MSSGYQEKEPWRPRPGELVQVWDTDVSKVRDHGRVGYVIRLSKKEDKITFKDRGRTSLLSHIEEGTVYKIISFGDAGAGEILHVHQQWLRKIEKLSDIKGVDNESR